MCPLFPFHVLKQQLTARLHVRVEVVSWLGLSMVSGAVLYHRGVAEVVSECAGSSLRCSIPNVRRISAFNQVDLRFGTA